MQEEAKIKTPRHGAENEKVAASNNRQHHNKQTTDKQLSHTYV